MKYMWLWMDIVLVYPVYSFSTMNLCQGKRERFLTLHMLAWCYRKKVLEMCVEFTCLHFGRDGRGFRGGICEEAQGCCVLNSLQGRAKSHSWAPQLNNDIFGKAVRKGQKMLHRSFKSKELEKYVRNSCVNTKGREGGRALKQMSSSRGPQWIRLPQCSPLRTPHCGRWRYRERASSCEELTFTAESW